MENVPSKVLALHFSKKAGRVIEGLVADSPFVDMLGNESSLADFEQTAISKRPEIIIIEHEKESGNFSDVVKQLRVRHPLCSVIAIAQEKDPDGIIEAMRVGVNEYLINDQSIGDTFREALLRLRSDKITEGDDLGGRIIGVMGAKGGVGVSHLAINIAWAMSQTEGMRVALVDLDLFGGNQAFMLDQEPSRDWSDVVAETEEITPSRMERFLEEIAPGLRLLAAPEDPSDAEVVGADHVITVLSALARNHSIVIVDLGDGLEETTLAAMDLAERVLLVVEPSLVGLKSAVRICSLGRRLGHGENKVRPVINRSNAKRSIAFRDVESVLGRKVLAWLPNDHNTIVESSNMGQPALRLRPKAKWSKSVADLAKKVISLNGDGK